MKTVIAFVVTMPLMGSSLVSEGSGVQGRPYSQWDSPEACCRAMHGDYVRHVCWLGPEVREVRL
jgi:hypothetical protein